MLILDQLPSVKKQHGKANVGKRPINLFFKIIHEYLIQHIQKSISDRQIYRSQKTCKLHANIADTCNKHDKKQLVQQTFIVNFLYLKNLQCFELKTGRASASKRFGTNNSQKFTFGRHSEKLDRLHKNQK